MFTNYVYKRRGVGGLKKTTFCKPLYHRKCKRRGVGGQKKPNLVNVVCERPLRLRKIQASNRNMETEYNFLVAVHMVHTVRGRSQTTFTRFGFF